jgi:hypothetical protein
MSDVTGNFGGESIRLRGMALEDTQYRIYEKIDQLLTVNQRIAEHHKKGLGDINSTLSRTAKSLVGFGDAADQGADDISKFRNTVVKGLGTAFNVLGEVISATGRTVRGMDSNIDDASFAIRAMSQNLDRNSQAVARFATDSINQLQDQYRSFKQMSDIGGVLSSQFEDLRSISSNMGVTMDQYAGLMQENFLNLRVGGRTVQKSMVDLGKAVEGIREDEEGLPYLFSRLGINVNEYGKTVLQMTALNRGLNEESVKNTKEFNASIRDAVITTIGLADAFGIERNKMLDAQRKALEDVRFARIFESLEIPKEEKDRIFKSFVGLTDGDEKKAIELMVGQFTGLATAGFSAFQQAGLGPMMDEIVKNAGLVNKNAMTQEQYQERIGKNLNAYADRFGDIANMLRLYMSNNPMDQAMLTALNMQRRYSTTGSLIADAQTGSAEALTNAGKTQIDVLTDLQLENVKMAVIASEANKALNTFGLTLAHSTQLLSGLMISATGGFAKGMQDHPAFKQAASELNQYINEFKNSVDVSARSEAFGNEFSERLKQTVQSFRTGGASSAGSQGQTATQTSAGSTTGNGGPTFLGSTADNPITVKTTTSGQTQRIPVHKLDEVSGQYNQGGRAHPSINQLLGVLSGASDITVTGIKDAYGGRGANSAHNRGLAVDFTIPGGAAAYREKYDFVYNQLRHGYGLDPAKGDFKIFDEANFPLDHTTGAHMHVEFSEQGAAKFQKAFENLQGASGPGGANNNTMTPPPAAASPATSSSAAPAAASPAATVNDATTAVSSMSSNVNNSTTVAIADPELLAKLDILNTQMKNVNNSVVSFGVKLEAAMFG